MRDADLVFIDVETTGARFGFHELIEVAAIRTDPSGAAEKDALSFRLLPRHPERLTKLAFSVNGYTGDRWRGAAANDAPPWNEFRRRFSGCVPVCHNPAFDRGFIEIACNEAGVMDLGLGHRWIGTESLAWILLKRGVVSAVSLASLPRELGVDPEPEPHVAIEGARLCQRIYVAIMRRLPTGP